jgi:ABC-type transporter Mla subunit MlaD
LRTQIPGWRRGAAAIAGALSVVALVLAVALALSAGGSSGSYTVRAIFDDAGNIIPGEDVMVDGVKVGTVGSVTPTPQAKAAVVMHIDNPGFKDFREDASCTIRPRQLIGEKIVDCLPTQPRVEGTPLPPPLKRIPAGHEGAGEWLLPVARTHSPVDPDLLSDIMRLPQRQRFTILINELGATFAGRGGDLKEVIKRADPTLQELEKVLSILAGENHVLTHLAVEGDRALAPLAADRGRLADFITQANTVAQASARHRPALAQDLANFPPFLEQLGPAMQRLERFADQTIPVFSNLGVAAPGVNKVFQSIAPFSKSSEAFFKSLGSTAKTTGPAFKSLEPLLARGKTLGGVAKPFADNFSGLLTNLKSTGGLERLLDFIYLGGGAVNGYDSLGHFLRAEIVAAPACLTYDVQRSGGCTDKFVAQEGAAAKASAASTSTTSLVMERTLAVLKGMTPAQARARYPGTTSEEAGTSATAPGSVPPGGVQPVGGAAAGTTYYTPSEEGSEANGMLLNYLLGN